MVARLQERQSCLAGNLEGSIKSRMAARLLAAGCIMGWVAVRPVLFCFRLRNALMWPVTSLVVLGGARWQETVFLSYHPAACVTAAGVGTGFGGMCCFQGAVGACWRGSRKHVCRMHLGRAMTSICAPNSRACLAR